MEMAKLLPKTLPGAVCAQWVRCGKPGCRSARGELHGPYFYRFWREGGRLCKVYVPRSALAQVRAQCQDRRDQNSLVRIGWRTWRQLQELVRKVEQLREAQPT
jgi:hypothetical protein